MKTVKELNKYLVASEKSESVAVVFFGSGSEQVFSAGVTAEELGRHKESGHLPKYIQVNADYIQRFQKPTVAMYSGESSGTAFGVFGGSLYCLGTPSCSLRVTELAQGLLPAAGLAYHMARGCREGCALARYAAVTQCRLYGHELLALGLLTHLVSENPHDSLAFGISQTINDSRTEQIKSRYISPVDVSLLPELIADMDPRDPAGSGEEVDWDVHAHPMWQHASLVPERTLSDLDSVLGEVDPEAELELEAVLRDVDRCFNNVMNQTVEDSVNRLMETDSAWSRAVLKDMSTLDPEVVRVWYALTSGATRWSYREVLSAEYTAQMNLLHRQREGAELDLDSVFTQLPKNLPANFKPLKFL